VNVFIWAVHQLPKTRNGLLSKHNMIKRISEITRTHMKKPVRLESQHFIHDVGYPIEINASIESFLEFANNAII
jgi:hypothetical protein